MVVSKLLKKLVNIGLVIRYEDKNDSRDKIVSLTKSGTSLAQVLLPIVERINKEFFGVIGNIEKKLNCWTAKNSIIK